MPVIRWDESLKVGISEIDEQHQRLIGYINDLQTAMLEGKARDRVALVLEDLIAYADVHFKTEEHLMERYGYADTPLHKLEHGNFVNKVSRLMRDCDGMQISVTLDLMKFLRDWLTGHIMNTDRRYAPFLKSKGVA